MPAYIKRLDASRAELGGNLTNESVVSLVAEGNELLKSAQTEWVLDMSQVNKVSSAAVALLLEWLRSAINNRIEFKIEHLPDHMRPIMEISDLNAVFEPLLN